MKDPKVNKNKKAASKLAPGSLLVTQRRVADQTLAELGTPGVPNTHPVPAWQLGLEKGG